MSHQLIKFLIYWATNQIKHNSLIKFKPVVQSQGVRNGVQTQVLPVGLFLLVTVVAMAHLLAHLYAGVNWADHAAGAWTWAKTASSDGVSYLQTLPRTCQVASAHAVMVCAGAAPNYSPLGFGAFSVCWAWLLIGVVFGIVLTLLVTMLTGHFRKDVTATTLANFAARPLVATGPRPIGAQASQDILCFILEEGQPALQELATATGMTEADFMQRMFSANTRPPPASVPALGLRQQAAGSVAAGSLLGHCNL